MNVLHRLARCTQLPARSVTVLHDENELEAPRTQRERAGKRERAGESRERDESGYPPPREKNASSYVFCALRQNNIIGSRVVLLPLLWYIFELPRDLACDTPHTHHLACTRHLVLLCSALRPSPTSPTNRQLNEQEGAKSRNHDAEHHVPGSDRQSRHRRRGLPTSSRRGGDGYFGRDHRICRDQWRLIFLCRRALGIK